MAVDTTTTTTCDGCGQAIADPTTQLLMKDPNNVVLNLHNYACLAVWATNQENK